MGLLVPLFPNPKPRFVMVCAGALDVSIQARWPTLGSVPGARKREMGLLLIFIVTTLPGKNIFDCVLAWPGRAVERQTG